MEFKVGDICIVLDSIDGHKRLVHVIYSQTRGAGESAVWVRNLEGIDKTPSALYTEQLTKVYLTDFEKELWNLK